jgi:DNA-binding FadR family transcriptional regulator
VQMQAGRTYREGLATHTAVYDAIIAGDGPGAGQAMERILSQASSEIAVMSRRKPTEQ